MKSLLFLIPLLLQAADPKEALTFHASFDKGPNADFAKGDKSIYFAESYKDLSKAVKGFGEAPVEIENGALRFKSKHTTALFFKAQDNVSPSTGSISFKLKLDPAVDLAPDYVDPIQFTDKAYNDSAIWVDFTRDDKPRLFRLGVFGELKSWSTPGQTPANNAKFNERLVVVKNSPFSRDKWTHIVITYANLGTAAGTASMYIDGKLQGTNASINEPFVWAPNQATVRLGVNYTGLLDDLAIYNRVLTAQEVASLN